jgi:hypothetical protein
VHLEGLGVLKNSLTSGNELSPLKLVAQCLNQLFYRIPQSAKDGLHITLHSAEVKLEIRELIEEKKKNVSVTQKLSLSLTIL